jgi:hypothetical protein
LPSPLPQCTQSTLPPLLGVLFSCLFIIQVVFPFCRAGVSLSRGLCWFIPGVAVRVPRAAYLLTCWPASPRQVWSWCWQCRSPRGFSAQRGVENLCVGWGFGSQGCASSWWFFCAKCGSSISARFLIYGAHAICFLPLVSILDPPSHVWLFTLLFLFLWDWGLNSGLHSCKAGMLLLEQ